MKIHDIEYNWNKAYKLDEGEQGCVYRVWCSCNYYAPLNKTITYVTDIFSGAVAIFGELNIKVDIIDEIVDRLSRNGVYVNYDHPDWTYYIEPIDIWKLESV